MGETMSDVTIDVEDPITSNTNSNGPTHDTNDTPDEILFSFDMADQPERKPSLNAQGYEIGVCRVCGGEAATRQPRTTATASDIPSRPKQIDKPRTRKGQPTADEWNTRIFSKGVLIVTSLVAAGAIRRYNINDPNDAIRDQLEATDDEAKSIARPIGRFVATTGFNKRMGRQVLDNSDLLDAAFSLYEWYDRVNKTLRTFATQTHLASVSPIREGGNANVTTEPTTTNDGNPGDFPDFGPPPII